ncbi:MAG: hypothetical protein ACRDNS_34675 [Trebonia sp.]
MLGDLIARLHRPDVCADVLTTLDPAIRERLERRAANVSMTAVDFAAGAVREFVERADDDLWFQLLTLIRKADDPGTTAVQTILRWTVVEQEIRS